MIRYLDKILNSSIRLPEDKSSSTITTSTDNYNSSRREVPQQAKILPIIVKKQKKDIRLSNRNLK